MKFLTTVDSTESLSDMPEYTSEVSIMSTAEFSALGSAERKQRNIIFQ